MRWWACSLLASSRFPSLPGEDHTHAGTRFWHYLTAHEQFSALQNRMRHFNSILRLHTFMYVCHVCLLTCMYAVFGLLCACVCLTLFVIPNCMHVIFVSHLFVIRIRMHVIFVCLSDLYVLLYACIYVCM